MNITLIDLVKVNTVTENVKNKTTLFTTKKLSFDEMSFLGF